MRGLTWETCLPHQPLLGQNLHGLDGLKREKKMTHHRRGYSKVSFLEELCLQSHEASENKRFMLHPRCVRVKRLSDSHSRCCRLRCTPAWQRRRSPGVVQEGGNRKWNRSQWHEMEQLSMLYGKQHAKRSAQDQIHKHGGCERADKSVDFTGASSVHVSQADYFLV